MKGEPAPQVSVLRPPTWSPLSKPGGGASLSLPETQRAWQAGLAHPDHQGKSIHGSDREPRGRMALPPRGKGPRGFRAPCSQGSWAVSRGKCSAGWSEVHAGFQVR